jgi:hypothetical protein
MSSGADLDDRLLRRDADRLPGRLGPADAPRAAGADVRLRIFTREPPAPTRDANIRLRELLPADESLGGVFAYPITSRLMHRSRRMIREESINDMSGILAALSPRSRSARRWAKAGFLSRSPGIPALVTTALKLASPERRAWPADIPRRLRLLRVLPLTGAITAQACSARRSTTAASFTRWPPRCAGPGDHHQVRGAAVSDYGLRRRARAAGRRDRATVQAVPLIGVLFAGALTGSVIYNAALVLVSVLTTGPCGRASYLLVWAVARQPGQRGERAVGRPVLLGVANSIARDPR